MEIQERVIEKDVIDYDFMFVGGSKLTMTVDVAADTVTETDVSFVFNVAEKPSFSDPDEVIDAEELTVYKKQLAAVAKRPRKQRMPSEEELFSMKQTLHALAKGIQ